MPRFKIGWSKELDNTKIYFNSKTQSYKKRMLLLLISVSYLSQSVVIKCMLHFKCLNSNLTSSQYMDIINTSKR